MIETVDRQAGELDAAIGSPAAGLRSLLRAAAVYDRSARRLLRITGEDRVRWLNGMVTNSVKDLASGAHLYTLLLNAQGRILGDATIHALPDQLLLETDRAQAEKLYAHLDHFIIMDDVELTWAEGFTALGVAGPEAPALLASLGYPVPAADRFAGSFSGDVSAEATVVAEYSPEVPHYSLWTVAEQAGAFQKRLLDAGASAACADAVDALRVLQGLPLYGVDLDEKTLAQETGQTRALHFSKGCYLGQEIVERIRSRAGLHRGLRCFALAGEAAQAGAPLSADGAPFGALTSVTPPGLFADTQFALGVVRIEALDRAAPLSYPGGTARALAASPLSELNRNHLIAEEQKRT